jgi:hypothetical protein
MKINILAAADALSGHDLLAHLDLLADRERSASAELVAHLAALESRPDVYAAKGYGSLFTYCTQALRFSEDAVCNRIEAAKACRRFPILLDLLASGYMTLTSVRILGRHLTPENHQAVVDRAKGRTRHQIEALVAELAPRPDVPSSIRRVAHADGAAARAGHAPAGRDRRGLTGHHDRAATADVQSFGTPDRPAHRTAAVPVSVHHGRRHAREVGAPSGEAPS